MKKLLSFLMFLIFSLFVPTACLNSFLDESPESGLTEDEVFTKYSNTLKFFDFVYGEPITGNVTATTPDLDIRSAFPLRIAINVSYKASLENLTDMVDLGLSSVVQSFRLGTMYPKVFINRVLTNSYVCIRVANITLEKVDQINDITPEDKYDLIAQAYFVRGFCHFEAFKGWGAQPYLTKPLGPNDEWDVPRLSKYETCMKVAADLDSAVYYFEKAGRMRRDPGPGEAGHLNHPDQFRPNGVAAIALKGRVLLYAASPLNNEGNDISYWEDAAKANWEAIQVAKQYKYELLSAANYKQNFNGAKYSNEQLYGWYFRKVTYNDPNNRWLVPGVFSGIVTNHSTECPTQNTVDKYETIWGDPLTTQGEREEAARLGHYNEQNPYANRDPRLAFSIIYNQSPLTGWQQNKAQIYYEMVNGKPVYSELLDNKYPSWSKTGYYQRKRWGGESTKSRISVEYTDPIIRLGELYLNYAEAANEAYGPNTPAPGSSLSAVQAINIIRNRIGMGDVLSQFTSNKEEFRTRIKNERIIELAFEGHYTYDIRRWKDAPAIYSGIIMGMDIEKVPVSQIYPTGFKYIRKPLPDNRQMVWREAMYYYPLVPADYDRMKNYELYPKW